MFKKIIFCLIIIIILINVQVCLAKKVRIIPGVGIGKILLGMDYKTNYQRIKNELGDYDKSKIVEKNGFVSYYHLVKSQIIIIETTKKDNKITKIFIIGNGKYALYPYEFGTQCAKAIRLSYGKADANSYDVNKNTGQKYQLVIYNQKGIIFVFRVLEDGSENLFTIVIKKPFLRSIYRKD